MKAVAYQLHGLAEVDAGREPSRAAVWVSIRGRHGLRGEDWFSSKVSKAPLIYSNCERRLFVECSKQSLDLQT